MAPWSLRRSSRRRSARSMRRRRSVAATRTPSPGRWRSGPRRGAVVGIVGRRVVPRHDHVGCAPRGRETEGQEDGGMHRPATNGGHGRLCIAGMNPWRQVRIHGSDLHRARDSGEIGAPADGLGQRGRRDGVRIRRGREPERQEFGERALSTSATTGSRARACARPAPPRHVRSKLMCPSSSTRIRSCAPRRRREAPASP